MDDQSEEHSQANTNKRNTNSGTGLKTDLETDGSQPIKRNTNQAEHKPETQTKRNTNQAEHKPSGTQTKRDTNQVGHKPSGTQTKWDTNQADTNQARAKQEHKPNGTQTKRNTNQVGFKHQVEHKPSLDRYVRAGST
jgi:hypothetical protein